MSKCVPQAIELLFWKRTFFVDKPGIICLLFLHQRKSGLLFVIFVPLYYCDIFQTQITFKELRPGAYHGRFSSLIISFFP